MNLDPQYHLPPGRQAAVDALTSERFTRSPWFDKPPPELPLDDSPLMQGVRRRALSEALEGIEDETEEVA